MMAGTMNKHFEVGDVVFWLDPRNMYCSRTTVLGLREDGKIAQILVGEKKRHVDVKWLFPLADRDSALDAFQRLVNQKTLEGYFGQN